VEGKGHKWKPVVRQSCKDETVPCRREEEDPWDGSYQTNMIEEAVSFFKPVQKGFPRFA
jgi:hypothetical protein